MQISSSSDYKIQYTDKMVKLLIKTESLITHYYFLMWTVGIQNNWPPKHHRFLIVSHKEKHWFNSQNEITRKPESST